MTESVEISLIRREADLQMRTAGLDVGVVTDYAVAMADGAEFPPVVLFFDGEAYWPGDGFHRIEAAKRNDRTTISADVRQGSKRDAILFAVGANASHGLRRTQADKRRSVLAMLRDPEWSRQSDREIGKRCAVDHKTVASARREITGSGEIPTKSPSGSTRPASGEIPIGGQDAAGGGSMVERLLSKASDQALITECLRRGMEVSHAN